MSVDIRAIEIEIENVLVGVTGVTPVVWTMRTAPAEPTPGVTYIRARIARQPESPFFTDAKTRAAGVAYFEIFHDLESPSAIAAVDTLADAIKDAFSPAIFTTSIPFRVMKSYRDSTYLELPWRCEPVVVEWVAYG